MHGNRTIAERRILETPKYGGPEMISKWTTQIWCKIQRPLNWLLFKQLASPKRYRFGIISGARPPFPYRIPIMNQLIHYVRVAEIRKPYADAKITGQGRERVSKGITAGVRPLHFNWFLKTFLDIDRDRRPGSRVGSSRIWNAPDMKIQKTILCFRSTLPAPPSYY